MAGKGRPPVFCCTSQSVLVILSLNSQEALGSCEVKKKARTEDIMEWNLKAPCWEFAQLEQEAFKSLNAVGGSSSFGEQSTNTGDFSVDLKLGQVDNPGNEFLDKWKEPGVLRMASSPSGSSKRARGSNNGSQPVSCLVDGCNSDLSNCRDYHRRHKVCETHSKSPQVTIGGLKQRFCQQCSRFHFLEEFDEGKRSCRKRLDGHNRRRRKPQPEPVPRPGGVFSQYQGPQMLSFSGSQGHPSSTAVNHHHVWAGIGNAETDARPHHNQQHQPLHFLDKQDMFLGGHRAGKQISFLQSDIHTLDNQASLDASVCQPFFRTSGGKSQSGGGGGSKMLGERFATPVHELDCALSLLSCPPQTQTSGMGLSHIDQLHGSMSMLEPAGVSIHQNDLEPMDSIVVSNVSNSDVNCPAMFHMGSEVRSGAGASPTLPFHWE